MPLEKAPSAGKYALNFFTRFKGGFLKGRLEIASILGRMLPLILRISQLPESFWDEFRRQRTFGENFDIFQAFPEMTGLKVFP